MKRLRFSHGRLTFTNNMDQLDSYRRRSVGWTNDPPARIHPRIMFGAGCSLTEIFVEQHRISHVINCAVDADSPMWFRTAFPSKYACINAVDSLTANILDWYPVFEETMWKFLSENESKVIYVHCQCGINRSGFLSLLYACVRLKFDFNEVIRSIMSQRPCALTNPVYFKQSKEYCNGV